MKTAIIIIALFAVALSKSVKNGGSKRRYYAEEERANDNKHFVLMQDGVGKTHLVNLKYEPKHFRQADASDVTIYLYTRENPTTAKAFEMKAVDFNGTINSKFFDPSRNNVFTTHGWTANHTTSNNMIYKDAALAVDDCNVFVMDYSRVSHEFYTIARKGVPIVGKIAGEFINKILDTYKLEASSFKITGFSLGGQVVGAIGAAINGQASAIISLDPAQPLFFVDEPEDCIDPTDAEFVQVIHTNAGILGFRSSLGHADYFPNNGGINQPGCGPDLVGICAHSRAVDIYEESIYLGGFKSLQCGSYDEFKAGDCDGNHVAYLGGYLVDKESVGDFYLDTASKYPYALN